MGENPLYPENHKEKSHLDESISNLQCWQNYLIKNSFITKGINNKIIASILCLKSFGEFSLIVWCWWTFWHSDGWRSPFAEGKKRVIKMGSHISTHRHYIAHLMRTEQNHKLMNLFCLKFLRKWAKNHTEEEFVECRRTCSALPQTILQKICRFIPLNIYIVSVVS